MNSSVKISAFALSALLLAGDASAFCGFYVSKAPADLFNKSSEVILVRDGRRTVITMSNDFSGDVQDFALVVPVPVLLQREQIAVVDRGIFDRLDAYSAPRLVEYYDENPCMPNDLHLLESMAVSSKQMRNAAAPVEDEMKDYQVQVQARYTVGEYDIVLLSAAQSEGLERWLLANDYRIPAAAAGVLEPYIQSDMMFFVVKVNLEAHRREGAQLLRPIQIQFESDRFMLPIRLGMANAQDAQDLIVYAFTRQGRVEAVNYRTVKIPTDRNVPLFVERYFGEFYSDLFDRSYHREGEKAVFLEYAWNVSPLTAVKCDPCVSPPPVFNDFAEAGVNWVSGMNQSSEVFFTRLHVRYTRANFPQDLLFQVTPNRESFQGRYILNHPAEGDLTCAEGRNYLDMLAMRRTREIEELRILAGWTNPNYQNYIYEFEPGQDPYKPQRNEYMPVGVGDAPDSDPWNKRMMLSTALIALLLLHALRRNLKRRHSPEK